MKSVLNLCTNLSGEADKPCNTGELNPLFTKTLLNNNCLAVGAFPKIIQVPFPTGGGQSGCDCMSLIENSFTPSVLL